MQRKVLSWEECATLTVHWNQINYEKLNRVLRAVTIKSRYEKDRQVLSTPPLLLTPNKYSTTTPYILNGKHRAIASCIKRVDTDIILVNNSNELKFSTPRNTFGKEGLPQVLNAFDDRYSYISLCKPEGILTVEDLIRKYHLMSQ